MGFRALGERVMISRDARILSPETVSIGNYVLIDAFAILNGDITLGNYIHISSNCELFSGKHSKIVIGDYSGLSSATSVYGLSDEYIFPYLANPTIPSKYRNVTEKDVVIDRCVVVGTHSVILPGAHLSDGCSFAACSMINKVTQPGWFYSGIPCKKVYKRDLDEIMRLVNVIETEKQRKKRSSMT